jgi:hypothetical protein
MTQEKREVILSVRVSEDLADAIRGLADADERPLSKYIEMLLRRHASEKGLDVGKPKRSAK